MKIKPEKTIVRNNSGATMSECNNNCDSPETRGRHRCPQNHLEYRQVPGTTILHHLKQPWLHNLSAQKYFYCDDPDCPVVYFGDDDSTIEQAQLRTPVGTKIQSPDALVCYCFGVTRSEAHDSNIRKFVIDQTRAGACACQTRNPSGRCCLADFPEQ